MDSRFIHKLVLKLSLKHGIGFFHFGDLKCLREVTVLDKLAWWRYIVHSKTFFVTLYFTGHYFHSSSHFLPKFAYHYEFYQTVFLSVICLSSQTCLATNSSRHHTPRATHAPAVRIRSGAIGCISTPSGRSAKERYYSAVTLRDCRVTVDCILAAGRGQHCP